MSTYDLTSDAQIICDSSKVSDGGLLADDLPEDTDEGLFFSEPRPRHSTVSMVADLRDGKGREKRSPRPRPAKAAPQPAAPASGKLAKHKQSFAAWMLVLYRIASVCLLIVFAGGMIFGTRTLLSLGRVVSRQVEATETALTSDTLEADFTPASGWITFDEISPQTTADIKMGDITIKLSANEAIVLMALEYAVGFAAMLLFMNFHKIELKL